MTYAKSFAVILIVTFSAAALRLRLRSFPSNHSRVSIQATGGDRLRDEDFKALDGQPIDPESVGIELAEDFEILDGQPSELGLVNELEEDRAIRRPDADEAPEVLPADEEVLGSARDLITSWGLTFNLGDFSPKCQILIGWLAREWPAFYNDLWGVSDDNVFEPNWIIASPVDQFGHTAEELNVPKTCTKDDEECEVDFGLYKCESQADCIRLGAQGQCKPVKATVKCVGEEENPAKLCVGHSDSLYDRMYEVMVQTQTQLDITTLSAPDGRFLAACRNAMTYLHTTRRRIQVRVLMAALTSHVKTLTEELARDFLESESNMKIFVGMYRKGLGWWNHGKIIAVDGKLLIEGGHNMWDWHYLRNSPVHDVSLEVKGSSAIFAHKFANYLWRGLCFRTCTNVTFRRVGAYKRWYGFPKKSSHMCPTAEVSEGLQIRKPRVGNGVRVISLGRMGGMEFKFGMPWKMKSGPADTALKVMFATATESIKMSLQDLAGVVSGRWGLKKLAWPPCIMNSLCQALINGAHLYLVLSTPNSIPDELSMFEANYGNGWSAKRVARKFIVWLGRYTNSFSKDDTKRFRKMVCERVHVANIRYHKEENEWISRYKAGRRIGNHAKVYIIDDKAFYIGSENLYPASLAEYGLFVDDREKTMELLSDYWDDLWDASKRTAVSGNGVSECDL